MKKIDLHIHSFYSDGEISPEAILKKVFENNINLFSITDHNFISQEIYSIEKKSKENNIIFIPGVEISSIDRITKKPLHILGYSASFNIEKINKILKPIVKGYNDRAKNIIYELNKKYPGINLNFKNLKNTNKEVFVSRNTLAKELIKFLNKEQIENKEVLKEVFAEEDNSWMLDSKESIEIIKNNKGMPVLSHPGNLVREIENFENFIERLKDYGLLGIEVYNPRHDIDLTKFLITIANKFNLLVTAGSDWHSDFYSPNISVGLEVEEKICTKIIRKCIL